ncbi:hypothetical protein TVAG_410210 [Trichomonas vaginalis G3]|uniref:Uncharacterized protein n=1 Tax=Trichomonas vaginalis (strain ATCC PRA-98 / G3) TaxID=412133 RepID=A2E8I4_TRIV3|nr:ankyrin repeat protein family [Trichomonas vaginalis G3]EAY11021.1 hypothetical protein TVAG_410210 [Trichomonas vaginalis G3]KAI5531805.1 ankyrin repeat protein family [Trichomonas vaginalis G3]|eukprot:XP_001323244.1 hypothetical protein [Trichomonas vaginalis G3]
MASQNGNLKLVKSLIICMCDKETRSNDDFTPLFLASREDHLEVVQYLISVGANKDAKDEDGNTPLIWAANNGHLEVVKYLVSAGADYFIENNKGWTPEMVSEGQVREYLESLGGGMSLKPEALLKYQDINDM